MRNPLLLALGLALVMPPAPTRAQVQVQIHVDLPAILPPLVVIQPGVRVVQDLDEEVFFVGGYYWVARGDTWYRSRDHRGPWGSMKPKKVPAELTRLERGHYRRWQHDEHQAAKKQGKGHGGDGKEKGKGHDKD